MSFDKTLLHYSLWFNQEEFFLKLGFFELNQVQGEIAGRFAGISGQRGAGRIRGT